MRARGRERIGVGGGKEDAVLPGGGDGHPLPGEDILPHRGSVGARTEGARVYGAVAGQSRVGVVEVEEFPTVGKGRLVLGNLGHSLPPA